MVVMEAYKAELPGNIFEFGYLFKVNNVEVFRMPLAQMGGGDNEAVEETFKSICESEKHKAESKLNELTAQMHLKKLREQGK